MTRSMFALRWARGFFRAWIAIAALWLVFVSVRLLSDFPSMESKQFQIVYDGGRMVSVEEANDDANIAMARGDLEAEGRLRLWVDEKVLAYKKARIRAIKDWVLIALLPPTALLLMGIAAAWVLRGFRNDIETPPQT